MSILAIKAVLNFIVDIQIIMLIIIAILYWILLAIILDQLSLFINTVNVGWLTLTSSLYWFDKMYSKPTAIRHDHLHNLTSCPGSKHALGPRTVLGGCTVCWFMIQNTVGPALAGSDFITALPTLAQSCPNLGKDITLFVTTLPILGQFWTQH